MIEPQGWVESADGVKLYYSTVGTGDHVVVFPCGFYADEEFAPLADGRTFVILHPRGRGRSDAPDPATSTIQQEASDLEAVRRQLGVERWSLIGWSYGGMVTSLYAIENPAAVERLVHLCSLGPDYASYTDEWTALREERAARTDQESLARLRDLYARGEFDKDPVGVSREHSRFMMTAQLADPNDASKFRFDFCEWPNEWPDKMRPRWEGLKPSFESWDERERMTAVASPMLVIQGTADAIPLACGRDVARLVPDARLLTIDRCGHYPWLERPEIFFPAVESFLSGEWPAGAEIVA